VAEASIDQVLAGIRAVETGGGNPAGRNIPTGLRGSASGYYQFTNSTWKRAAQLAGVGTQYRRAMDAPKWIQDAVAGDQVRRILKQSGGNVGAIPRVWYTGKDTTGTAADHIVARPDYGNTLTPAQYAAKWLKTYNKAVGSGASSSVSPTDNRTPATPAAGGSSAAERLAKAYPGFTLNADGSVTAPDGTVESTNPVANSPVGRAAGGLFGGVWDTVLEIVVTGVLVAGGAAVVVLGINSAT
jgi:hypothetical protein